jgi:2,3-diketo-5-methylthio-1-phosphopentane phosphatase
MNSSPKIKPLAVLVDFDGTITTEDIGVKVVNNFAEPGARKAEYRFRAGEINVRELWAIEIGLLRQERHDDTVEFVLTAAEIRSGFAAFVKYCSQHEIPLEVASSGMDFYVDAILDNNGFGNLPRARPIVRYNQDGHGVLDMPPELQDCSMTAMCKCARVWRLRRKGYRVMFVGDGVSDQCAVSQADIVLATGNLREACEVKGIDHIPFDTFSEVQSVVEKSSPNSN